MTYNGSDLMLYVDGVLKTNKSVSGSISTNYNNLSIGRKVNATIDELRIYSRALSQEEINASFKNKLYKLYNNFTSLDDGTYNFTAYAIDASGNLNITDMRNVTVSTGKTPDIISISLDQPVADPDIEETEQFSINCTAETGDASSGVNISFEFNYSSHNWMEIDTAGSENLTINLNPVENVANDTMYNATVTGQDAGTYNVRCRLYNSTTEINSSVQEVTVSAPSAQPPEITDIEDISSQQITESGVTWVTFNVTAYDLNGYDNLDDTSINGTFSMGGEELRENTSCLWLQDFALDYANYSCTIGIWYWDAGGDWNVSARIMDAEGAVSDYYNETFNLQSTTAIKVEPNYIYWNYLLPGATDTLAQNYTLVNNTGNVDIPGDGVKVTAIHLYGIDPTYWIPAANFSVVNDTNNCNIGTQLENGTVKNIINSLLPAGNNSNAEGLEYLYYCLEQVPSGIPGQNYTTELGSSWIISVAS